MKNDKKVRIAIFASGTGSNAQRLIDHFRNSALAEMALVVCNRPGAGVTRIAAREDIPLLMLEKERFLHGDAYLPVLQEASIGMIILAGFLWKIPATLVLAYPRQIINIHPALLPKFGGKGMYGMHVHQAVIGAGEEESGITIHYVDEIYDHGAIIFQVCTMIHPGETPESLALKIQQLEHRHFPDQVERLIKLSNRG